MKIENYSDEFFEALGEPNLAEPFTLSLVDHYRFHLVYRHLAPGSVLDVGAYLGDFLNLARQDGREIVGTEVNTARVNLANSILGGDVVVLDAWNGYLRNFQDASVENVVCTEVVEHVPDDRLAVSELCRVARTKVLITVPFRERTRNVLCVHCSKYTPYSGHLHTYDLGTFSEMVPAGWRVTKELHFAKRITRMLCSKLPKSSAIIPMLRLIDSLSPATGRWLLVVVERI